MALHRDGQAWQMPGSERKLLLGAAATFGIILAPLLLSSERHRNLVAVVMCLAVAIQLLRFLTRILSGQRSSYPPTWAPAHRRLIRTCQATAALVAAAAWAMALRTAYVEGALFSRGAIADAVANCLFAASVGSCVLLEIVGPRRYEDRDLVRIPLWIALATMILVFVHAAAVDRY